MRRRLSSSLPLFLNHPLAIANLEQDISAYRVALTLQSSPHPSHSNSLNGLENALLRR
jgi:hypothetical protein